MKDYSAIPEFSSRHMVTGFVVVDDQVREVQGFYCHDSNIDGEWNIAEGGVVKPGPRSTSPLYFCPETGSSTNLKSIHPRRIDAVRSARDKLIKQRDYIEDRLAELEAE